MAVFVPEPTELLFDDVAEEAVHLEGCSPECSNFQLGIKIELAVEQICLDNAFSSMKSCFKWSLGPRPNKIKARVS